MDTQDMLSNCSSTSTTLTFRGEDDIDAEKAIDQAVADCQQGLNGINVEFRNLLMAAERDDTYEEMYPHFDTVNDIVKDFKSLVRDILSINKQMMPKDKGGFKPPAKTAQTTK